MKKLSWQLVLPLTVISFFTVTMWWDTLPVDAPGTVFFGFPFPFLCNGWHTSLSLQIFFLELVADLLIYFLVWWLFIYAVNRLLVPVKIGKTLRVILIAAAAIIVVINAMIAGMPDNVFFFKRDFDIKVLHTGFRFVWQKTPYPSH